MWLFPKKAAVQLAFVLTGAGEGDVEVATPRVRHGLQTSPRLSSARAPPRPCPEAARVASSAPAPVAGMPPAGDASGGRGRAARREPRASPAGVPYEVRVAQGVPRGRRSREVQTGFMS